MRTATRPIGTVHRDHHEERRHVPLAAVPRLRPHSQPSEDAPAGRVDRLIHLRWPVAQRVAELLTAYRLRARLTQKQAARLSGVGEKTVSSMETGARSHRAQLSVVLALLNTYGIPFEVFARDLSEGK